MKTMTTTLLALLIAASAQAAESSIVTEFEDAFAQVADAVSPSVVRVTAAVKELSRNELYLFERPDPFDEFSRKFFGEHRKRYDYPLGVGSGVIFDASGLILTNEHVVSGQKTATVRLESGEVLKATVLGADGRADLAVLKVDAKRDLPAAKLGKAEDVRVGWFALAFGHPFGVGQDPQPTLTVGHISALGRTLQPRGDQRALTDLIQTDAAINPGNSGGPLVTLRGEVIGINVAIFTMSKGNQGIAFAIPMNERTKQVMKTLSVGQRVERGYFGVRTKDIGPDLAKKLGVEPNTGLLVDRVLPNSPSAKAGLKPGDILTAVGGKQAKASYQFRILAERLAPGTEVEVELLRDGKPLKLKLVVGRRNARRLAISRYGPKAWRGMEVSQIADPLIQKFGLKVQEGVVVTRVHEGSPAAQAGIREGMVVKEINRTPVETTKQFRDLAFGVGKDDALLLTDDGHKLIKAEK